MDHPKRSAHLDKRHRDMLQTLSHEDWAALVFPILQKKVDTWDTSCIGTGMLREMAALAHIPIGSVEPATPLRHQRMLVLTLRAMNLKTMVSTVQRGLAQEDSELESIGRSLVLHLRSLAVEADCRAS